MQNGKPPDGRSIAPVVAINLGRSHAGVAGEVIRVVTMLLQPTGHPLGMISQGSRVLLDRCASHIFQGLAVQEQVALKVALIVVIEIFAKVVMDPAAMAANGISTAHKRADPVLR